MMTYKQLAEWWHVPLGTVYSWVSRGCIPYVRLADRSVRFEPAALEAWLAERRTMPSAPRRRHQNGVAGAG